MGRKWSNFKSYVSLHKPEILGASGAVLGVAAFGTAIYATHKHGSDDYREIKAKRNELIRKKNCGEIEADEFRKENIKVLCKGAGTLAKDYAIPVGLEIGSHICYAMAGSSYRGQIKSLATDVAGLTATVAMMKANIEDEYGKDAVKKIMTVPTKKTVQIEDENGKKKKVEVELEDPELACVDSVAYQDSLKYGWSYSPTRIKIDERFTIYNTCNGDLAQMLFPLRCSYEMSNEQMWNDGVITVWDILKNIGLEGGKAKTINKSEAKRYGIIDQPKAYNRVTKKVINVPGFKDNGIAERKDGLDMTHKRITFGDAQDALIDDYECLIADIGAQVAQELYHHDETTNREYLYIDIGVDGDISMLRVEDQPWERKVSAWKENPKTQQ